VNTEEVRRFNSARGWAFARFAAMWIGLGLAYGLLTAGVDGGTGSFAGRTFVGAAFYGCFMMFFMSGRQVEVTLDSGVLGRRSWWGVWLRRPGTSYRLDARDNWVYRTRSGDCRLMPQDARLSGQPPALLEALARDGLEIQDDLEHFRANYPRLRAFQLTLRVAALIVVSGGAALAWVRGASVIVSGAIFIGSVAMIGSAALPHLAPSGKWPAPRRGGATGAEESR